MGDIVTFYFLAQSRLPFVALVLSKEIVRLESQNNLNNLQLQCKENNDSKHIGLGCG